MRRRRNAGSLVLLTILAPALLIALVLVNPVFAWKPTTHVYFADLAWKDAMDDGRVTIYRVDYETGEILGVLGEYAVDPQALAALQSFPAQYHAGVLGPDAYPDILTGQQVIHPPSEETGIHGGPDAWLWYLWSVANAPSVRIGGNRVIENRYNTPAIRAFVLGYLTHAAGDMYGHTFVNNFSGGPFALDPPRPGDFGNAVKHIVVEGYVDKRLPRGALDADFFRASIEGVDDFIYAATVDARRGTVLATHLLRSGGGGTEKSIPRIYSSIRDDVDRWRASYRETARGCAIYDPTCSATLANLAADYLENWRNDIDRCLREWPRVSHKVALALFFNPARVADTDGAQRILSDFATDHLLTMSGPPDVLGLGIGLLADIIDLVIPDAVAKEIKALLDAPLDAVLKTAIGMSKEDLKRYLTSPEVVFDEVMNSGSSGERVTLARFNSQYLRITDTGFTNPNESFDYTRVPAAFNTVTMSKLILLSPGEINRLLADLGVPAWQFRLEAPNVMLGFIPTLDGSGQWLDGMVFARDGGVYRQLFLRQPGESRPPNARPTVADDGPYATRVDQVLSVPAPGVLANDTDSDGDILTAVLNDAPAVRPRYGSVTLNADGSFVYTPSGVEVAGDSFGYWARDGQNESWRYATVGIRLSPGNKAPFARGDYYNVPGNRARRKVPRTFEAPAYLGVLSNDIDIDGDKLQTLFGAPPTHGNLELQDDGSFRYTPNTDFRGTDTFTYYAFDGNVGGASDETTVTLNVLADLNTIRTGAEGYLTVKDTPLRIPAPGVLANDSDDDGALLTAVYDGGRHRGTIDLQPDGSFVWTPEPGFVGGAGGFTYQATDGEALSAFEAVQLTVRGTNAVPFAEDDFYSLDERSTLEVPAPGILGNDSDADYDPTLDTRNTPIVDTLTVSLVSGPSFGALILRADGSFDYTPGDQFAGRDRFTYTTTDGFAVSSTATVRINDGTANEAPVAADDVYLAIRDAELLTPEPGVLGNDFDVDGDPLEAVVETGPSSGTLKLNQDGSFIYVPKAGFTGSDTFRYRVSDRRGGFAVALATITVCPPGECSGTILSFSAPQVAPESPEVARVLSRLEVVDVGGAAGIRGWELAIAVPDCEIIEATTAGTVAAAVDDDPPGLRRPGAGGFESTRILEGMIQSSVILDNAGQTVLPALPGELLDILAFTLARPADAGNCVTCRLEYLDEGTDTVTAGGSLRPTRLSRDFELCIQTGEGKQPPVISDFLDNTGVAGSEFTVLGSRFDAAGLVVRVCGVEAVFSLVSDGAIRVTAPACDPGPATVEVCTENGCDSDSAGFTYLDRAEGCEMQSGAALLRLSDRISTALPPGECEDAYYAVDFVGGTTLGLQLKVARDGASSAGDLLQVFDPSGDAVAVGAFAKLGKKGLTLKKLPINADGRHVLRVLSSAGRQMTSYLLKLKSKVPASARKIKETLVPEAFGAPLQLSPLTVLEGSFLSVSIKGKNLDLAGVELLGPGGLVPVPAELVKLKPGSWTLKKLPVETTGTYRVRLAVDRLDESKPVTLKHRATVKTPKSRSFTDPSALPAVGLPVPLP